MNWHKARKYLVLRVANILLRRRSLTNWCYLFPLVIKLECDNVVADIRSIFRHLESQTIEAIVYTSTEALCVIAPNSFTKYPITTIGIGRILKEYDNWYRITKNSCIRDLFLPEVVLDKLVDGLCYLRMPKATQIEPSESELAIASVIDGMLSSDRKEELGYISKDMLTGQKLVQELLPGVGHRYCESVLHNWKKKNVRIGPIHGDLHKGNIVRYENSYRLIDTDRCAAEGVQLFDIIHAAIGNMIVPHKDWVVCLQELKPVHFEQYGLTSYLSKTVDVFDDACKYAYMIDRIGKDNQFASNLHAYTRKDSVKAIILNSILT